VNQVLMLFAISLGTAAALAAIAIWSPRAPWIKVGALAITTSFVPLTYVSLVELLSRPKPIALEWGRAGLAEAKVLGAEVREGQSIYLWVRVPGVDEPRSYLLPWDQKLAQQLHKAQREANQRGTDVRARNLFKYGPRVDDHTMFYARPQEARPPKSAPDYQPYVFQSGPGGGGT
jgi:hypothetical protein